MIVTTKYSGPSNARGSRIIATVVGHDGPMYSQEFGWDHASSDNHGDAVRGLLAMIGSDVDGPVVVPAGSERNGYRWVILDGPGMVAAAERFAETNGVPAGSTVHPIGLMAPGVPVVGERVRSTNPGTGCGTVTGRKGKSGVTFMVKWDRCERPMATARGRFTFV
jgi:hypothetical protein